MTVGGMGFIPERLLMMIMMIYGQGPKGAHLILFDYSIIVATSLDYGDAIIIVRLR